MSCSGSEERYLEYQRTRDSIEFPVARTGVFECLYSNGTSCTRSITTLRSYGCCNVVLLLRCTGLHALSHDLLCSSRFLEATHNSFLCCLAHIILTKLPFTSLYDIYYGEPFYPHLPSGFARGCMSASLCCQELNDQGMFLVSAECRVQSSLRFDRRVVESEKVMTTSPVQRLH